MVASHVPSPGTENIEESRWLHNPCIFGVPKVERNHIGYLKLTFSVANGGEKRVRLNTPRPRGLHNGGI